MKHLKTLILMMLSVLIVLPAMAQEFEYEGIWYLPDGNGTCQTFAGYSGGKYSGDIVIPTTVSDGNNNYTVTGIAMFAFNGCGELLSVALPETITWIGDYAFCNCSMLFAINFPASLTSIGEYAFERCSALRSATFGEGLKTLGYRAFAECDSLASVSFSGDVASIGEGAFEGCGALRSATFGEGLKTLGYRAFADCDSLASVSFSGDVASIGEWAFYRCSNLSSVNFTGSVETIGQCAFYRCTSLNSLTFSGSVGSIESEAFYGCSSLTSMVFPESLQKLGYESFDQCRGLQKITLPASLSEFEDNVFAGCYDIMEVNYLATNPHEFYNDSQFEWEVYENATLNAPNAKLADIQATYPWSLFRHINALDGTTAPALDDGTDFEYNGLWYTVVSSYDMTCKTKAGEINGETVVPGNYVSGDIIIPSRVILDSNEYTVIGVGHDGFIGNTQLTSIQLPETVTYIGDSSFSGCVGLTAFDFPSSLTELGAYSFQDCTGFTSMEIPSTVTSIGAGLFSGCYNLASVSLPNTISSIGLNTFAGCSALTAFEIPTSVTSIGTGAFINCSGLATMTIPNSVEAIGISAFANCTGLKLIDIPSSVTSIGISAFAGCTGLTEVRLPASLTLLGSGAFAGCYDIANVKYAATSPITAEADVFTDAVYADATLEMVNAALGDILATTPWRLFRHIIAKDGSLGFISSGDDFYYQGIWYTIMDPETQTARTKEGGNDAAGDVVIPETAYDGDIAYTVTAIGEESFRGSDGLLSISLPSTIGSIGRNAFADCERLTSLVWTRHERMSERAVEEIGNPNLLLYVDSLQFAPEGMTANVVADGVCESLVLTPGRAFTPVREFTALESRMVKEFRQRTWIGNAGGWETIVLPFDAAEVYAENLGAYMTPFAQVTDVRREHPYWLSRADAYGEWTDAYGIEAGIPYIISMPNNPGYVDGYNVDGPVVFSNSQAQRITPATTAPYAVTWMSGREFRSLWLPLDEAEASRAMGLNVGIGDLRDDAGEFLAPGSAFHVGVLPKPLEAYVTRLDGERAMRVIGNQSGVAEAAGGSGLEIRVEEGVIYVRSDSGRTIHVFTPDGAAVRTVGLKAGRTETIDGLTPGIYLVEGRKIIVRN